MLRIRIWLSLFLYLLVFFASCFAAERLPTSEDVNTLAELAMNTSNSFYKHTFEIRMRHEFSGKFFSNEDRLALYNSALNSSRQLAEFISRLEDIIRQIEQYPHEDWDQHFGRTGLYGKASGSLSSTRLSKFGIDYYVILAADDKSPKELLQRIDLFSEGHNLFYLQLVKAKTLGLLAKTEPNYKPVGERLFSELRERSDPATIHYAEASTSQRLAFLASIERVKLESTGEDIEANRLARDLIETELVNDLEVILPLAFLQRRLGLVDNYNKLLQSNPRAAAIAADITLAWLEAGHEPVNPLDASLAAEAALRDDPQRHKELLLRLARQDTSISPVIDYAAAVLLADSNESQAVYLLIRAGKVLDEQSAEVLGLRREQIAANAAKLAYRVFVEDPNQCEPTTEAFENYFELAGQSADANLQYVYTQVLTLCGHHRQAIDMLRQIPSSAGQLYSKARLDLMSAEIASGLGTSIFDNTGYAPLFSRYLDDAGGCIYVEQATILLQSYLGQIELLEGDRSAYYDTIKHSKKISRFVYDCVKDKERVSLYAEFAALDANTTSEELTEVDKLLAAAQNPGVDFNTLRARARLARRRGNFAEAARLWAEIAERNGTANHNSRSWQWWRAKYYQLECAARAGNNGEVTHALDVLRATYTSIPEPWAAKLESLAQDIIQ